MDRQGGEDSACCYLATKSEGKEGDGQAQAMWDREKLIQLRDRIRNWEKPDLYVKWGLPMVKNLPGMQETQVQSLGWEDPLEKGMATHSSILAWEIPWTEEPGGLQFMGSQRVGHD